MRFIEKNPAGRAPLTLRLVETRETTPEYDNNAMNFSLLTDKNEDVAAGRCVVLSEPGSRDYLYISAIYVEGNTNKPTKSHPNRFVGLGQLLLFSAIRYGMEQNIENASLLPVDDSQGFYLKMGFHPTIITDTVNRMVVTGVPLSSGHGKLNAKWRDHFYNASFLNPDFRGPNWSGNIRNIHLNLRHRIMTNWTIVG
ncbi:GNAT family N-acetyltransferase [Rahnella sp. PD4]|uniref:GNAT family N-acetyltransferase n=1 Tax=Rahnella sp. PD4 TaxID=3368611 RepID=UPI003BA2939C